MPAKPGTSYLCYQPEGGSVDISVENIGAPYKVIGVKAQNPPGDQRPGGKTTYDKGLTTPDSQDRLAYLRWTGNGAEWHGALPAIERRHETGMLKSSLTKLKRSRLFAQSLSLTSGLGNRFIGWQDRNGELPACHAFLNQLPRFVCLFLGHAQPCHITEVHMRKYPTNIMEQQEAAGPSCMVGLVFSFGIAGNDNLPANWLPGFRIPCRRLAKDNRREEIFRHFGVEKGSILRNSSLQFLQQLAIAINN